jgi:NAD(P)-dependent dehydrogenase (short-subunit alcohol dehydrogenase family)
MLAAQGGTVVIADMQVEKGEAVAKEIGGAFVKCDVSNEADGQAVVAKATSLGKLMGLVNCAGIAPAEKTVGKNGAHSLAVQQDHHGQPGGQLQHDPSGGRCHVQERTRKPPASAG